MGSGIWVRRDLAGYVVGAHTEEVEAQRLLPLAGDSDHDRGPYNLIGFAAAGSSVGMEQHF
jgi:hypothetical protein